MMRQNGQAYALIGYIYNRSVLLGLLALVTIRWKAYMPMLNEDQ